MIWNESGMRKCWKDSFTDLDENDKNMLKDGIETHVTNVCVQEKKEKMKKKS